MTASANKIVFGAVLYRQALIFLNDFITSVSGQAGAGFDLLFVNDNLTWDEMDYILTELRTRYFAGRVNIIQGDMKKSIADFRIQLLSTAKKLGYELLVIGDCDDTFSRDRIKAAVGMAVKFQSAAFFYNDIIGEDLSPLMLEIPSQVQNIEQISQYNFLGMSNTTIRLDALENHFIESLYDGSCPIFDWYLYSRMLLAGKYGVKTVDAYTKYRLYDGNAVGIPDNNLACILREKEVKHRHYHLLREKSRLFSTLSSMLDAVEIDETFYVSQYCRRELKNYWWEKILLEV